MAQEVALLDLPISPFAARVRIALSEKGIEYESKVEDLENKSSLLLEMNPVLQFIPVLIHKGKPVCESNLIVEYIDETWNHKSPLLPCDPYERANARFWADFVDNKLNVSIRRLMWASDSQTKEAAAKEIIGWLNMLDQELGEKKYYGGDVFGFLDISVLPFYNHFYTFETVQQDFVGRETLAKEYPKVVKEFPRLTAWAKRCLAKENVSKSMQAAFEVHEYIVVRRKKLGLC